MLWSLHSRSWSPEHRGGFPRRPAGKGPSSCRRPAELLGPPAFPGGPSERSHPLLGALGSNRVGLVPLPVQDAERSPVTPGAALLGTRFFIVAGQQWGEVPCVLSSSCVWWPHSLPQFPPSCLPKHICWPGSCLLGAPQAMAGKVGAGGEGAAVPGHAGSGSLRPGHCAHCRPEGKSGAAPLCWPRRRTMGTMAGLRGWVWEGERWDDPRLPLATIPAFAGGLEARAVWPRPGDVELGPAPSEGWGWWSGGAGPQPWCCAAVPDPT